MRSRPGERFHYNNGGFVLLGLVIEQTSGMTYADYVEEHVFARAEMRDAGFFEVDRLPPRTALGFLPDGRNNSTELTGKGMPDGGAYVSAADMGAFWDALLGGTLLGAKKVERLVQPHSAIDSTEDDGACYGYGLWLPRSGGTVARYSCSGADPGVAFFSSCYLAQQVDLTVLGNTEAAAWPMVTAMARLIEAE